MHSVDMAECNYKINPPEVSKRIHILISQTWIRKANDFVMVRRHQDSSSRYDPFFSTFSQCPTDHLHEPTPSYLACQQYPRDQQID